MKFYCESCLAEHQDIADCEDFKRGQREAVSFNMQELTKEQIKERIRILLWNMKKESGLTQEEQHVLNVLQNEMRTD